MTLRRRSNEKRLKMIMRIEIQLAYAEVKYVIYWQRLRERFKIEVDWLSVLCNGKLVSIRVPHHDSIPKYRSRVRSWVFWIMSSTKISSLDSFSKSAFLVRLADLLEAGSVVA